MCGAVFTLWNMNFSLGRQKLFTQRPETKRILFWALFTTFHAEQLPRAMAMWFSLLAKLLASKSFGGAQSECEMSRGPCKYPAQFMDFRKTWTKGKSLHQCHQPCCAPGKPPKLSRPGMSWVRELQATQRVLVCHVQDPCRRPGGQDMPAHAGFTLTCLGHQTYDPAHAGHTRTYHVAQGSLTLDMRGHGTVSVVICALVYLQNGKDGDQTSAWNCSAAGRKSTVQPTNSVLL